jgi:hypothetical protein
MQYLDPSELLHKNRSVGGSPDLSHVAQQQFQKKLGQMNRIVSKH